MNDKFKELGISEEILKAIEELRFEEPTDIQAQAIPLILEGKDVIAGSATGSGKTLAFSVGIIRDAKANGGIQALILTPTRELAEQIYMAIRSFSKFKPLNVVSIYGGVSINPQFKQLETAEIVVGTPGRILDHLERGTIDLSNIKTLILDEADRMLDMGFIDDVNKIISQCPTERQMLLFSATISPDIEDLTNNFMKDPVKVSVDCYVDPKKLHQIYYDVKNNLKFSLLAHLLKQDDTGLVMVFCNSRKFVDVVSANLNKLGIKALSIHGGLTQNKRSFTINQFNKKGNFVLVCTDVAARGLDIPGVTHIYNYDLPDDSKQYIHRIGRTARAGESGRVINLVGDRDHENFGKVFRDFDVQIDRVEKPHVERINMVTEAPRRRSGYGGRGGPRGSFGSRRHSDRRGSPRRN